MTLRIKTLTAVAALTLGAAAWAQETTVTVPVPENATPAQAADAVADAANEAAQAVGDAAGEAAGAAADATADAATTAAEAVTPAATEAAPVETATEAADATADTAGAAAEAEGATASETVAAEDAATAEAAPAAEAPAEAPAEATETPTEAAEETAGDTEMSEQGAVNTEAATATEEAETEAVAAETPADVDAAQVEGQAAADEAATDEAAGSEEDAAAEAEEHAEEGGEEASHEAAHIEDIAFSFEGPFGKYDQFQLQRGLQVYTEVCSACHGLKQVAIRTLHDEGGPGLPEDQVRAFAASMDITDPETGEDRPRLPTDHFPTIVQGDGMGPDLSLMAKARAGFHGPYGTGINQLIRGIGGPEYIHAVLTGYDGEEKEQAGTVLYHNTAFAGNWISMPAPLSDDLVTYEDGTPATVDQMARDVSAFLMWTAEPKMMDRKQVGFVSVIFLTILAALLYLTNKRLWWSVKHGRDS